VKSALYIGNLRHRRFSPKSHDFSYHLVYFFLDLEEVERIFRVPFLFSQKSPALFAFRRKDYYGEKTQSLSQSIRDLVKDRTSKACTGPIRVFTQISYFGFCFNPVSVYYCFDQNDEYPEFIVADVTNTPWHERHAYVVECKKNAPLKFEVPKVFHVSPFMPMDIVYRWNFNSPGETLAMHMENISTIDGQMVFDSTMAMKRRKLTFLNVIGALGLFPLMTVKAFAAIYLEAVFLKIKGLRFHPHPTSGDKS
jgi:DUF1365 family protein